MTIQSQIIDLLATLWLKEETKSYWTAKISSLSDSELKRLYRILMSKNISGLDRCINQENKYQETLKDKIKKIPILIKKIFSDAEKDENINPDNILEQKLNNMK